MPAYGSSAGTVYLQDGNTAEGAGTITVANIASSTAEDAKTGFPSLANNAPIDNLTQASLEVSNNSKVIFIAGVKMNALNVASGSSIDLAGKTVIVKRAKLGGTNLSPGTYAASDAAVSAISSPVAMRRLHQFVESANFIRNVSGGPADPATP